MIFKLNRKILAHLLFATIIFGCFSNVIPSSTQTFEQPDNTAPVSTAQYQNLKSVVSSSCLPTNEHPQKDEEIPWILLAVRGVVPYAIDPNTGTKSDQLLLGSESTQNILSADYFHVSPNGEWLAYNLVINDSMLTIVEPSNNILTSGSQQRIVLDIKPSAAVGGWSNNELIFLISGHSLEKFGTTLVLNPFTKEQEEFSFEGLPSYLDYQPGMNGSYLFAHSNLMPDSTLKRLVYPAVIENQFTTILWDVENKRILASLRLYLDQWFNDPLWSLDGENLLIMGIDEEENVEWFQISRNGNIQQLTYFGEFLKDYKIERPSRSWDGRYLAFQLFYDSGENVKYIVLDLEAPTLEGLCIDVTQQSQGSAPVWSPDNRYLAITDGNTGDSSQILLVDIVDHEAFQIGKDVDGIGWIQKP